MFENKQVKSFFETSLNCFFDTKLDSLFNYKKVAPISCTKKTWKSYKKTEDRYVNKEYLITEISDWDVSGNTGWQKITDSNGVYFTNNDISDNQSAVISKTFKNVTKVSFFYKVSSEQNYDFLTININGVQKVNVSGEVDWTYYEQSFSNPTNVTITFNYHKDYSASSGTDSGYFKELKVTKYEFIPAIIDFKIVYEKGFHVNEKITRFYKRQNKDVTYPLKRDFNNEKQKVDYKIIPYFIKNTITKYPIVPYKNLQNFVFYKIGIQKFPPKRIIIKDLDD